MDKNYKIKNIIWLKSDSGGIKLIKIKNDSQKKMGRINLFRKRFGCRDIFNFDLINNS